MRSGAMIFRISLFSSVIRTVGMIPSVVPASGSTAISGTGMKGAWDGSNHRVMAEYHCLGLGEDCVQRGCAVPGCADPGGAAAPGCAHTASDPGSGGPTCPGDGGGAAGAGGVCGASCACA